MADASIACPVSLDDGGRFEIPAGARLESKALKKAGPGLGFSEHMSGYAGEANPRLQRTLRPQGRGLL
jgi:hypothetical protein